jgi:hypothetical protein
LLTKHQHHIDGVTPTWQIDSQCQSHGSFAAGDVGLLY